MCAPPINNQCWAIRREFQPVGPTLLKDPLGACWGLLPSWRWVASWLPTNLDDFFRQVERRFHNGNSKKKSPILLGGGCWGRGNCVVNIGFIPRCIPRLLLGSGWWWLLSFYDFDEVVRINCIHFYLPLKVFSIVVHADLFSKLQV